MDKSGILGGIIIALAGKLIYDKGRYDVIHTIYKNGMSIVVNDEQDEKEEG